MQVIKGVHEVRQRTDWVKKGPKCVWALRSNLGRWFDQWPESNLMGWRGIYTPIRFFSLISHKNFSLLPLLSLKRSLLSPLFWQPENVSDAVVGQPWWRRRRTGTLIFVFFRPFSLLFRLFFTSLTLMISGLRKLTLWLWPQKVVQLKNFGPWTLFFLIFLTD